MRVDEGDLTSLRSAVLRVLEEGRPGTTMCPSDVARKLDPVAWRTLMPGVRDAACALAEEGLAEVLQGGAVIDGRRARGPIRVRRAGPPERDGTAESA